MLGNALKTVGNAEFSNRRDEGKCFEGGKNYWVFFFSFLISFTNHNRKTIHTKKPL